MTEDQALTKLCPMRFHCKGPPPNRKCSASDCMAWQWEDIAMDLNPKPHPNELQGYCGLAGHD